jgi:hypothetical protein
MVATTSSRARGVFWRVWVAVGPASRPLSGLPAPPSASRRQAATDATSIGDGLPPHPRAARTRPETDDLMAATI